MLSDSILPLLFYILVVEHKRVIFSFDKVLFKRLF